MTAFAGKPKHGTPDTIHGIQASTFLLPEAMTPEGFLIDNVIDMTEITISVVGLVPGQVLTQSRLQQSSSIQNGMVDLE